MFRLAIADYHGRSYSHDQQSVARAVARRCGSEAATFLTSEWAAYLADLVGCEAGAIWREAYLLETSGHHWRTSRPSLKLPAEYRAA